MTVLAFTRYRTNAELILALRDLGYLHADWLTLDPTWGRGTFWKLWRPDRLITHDLEPDGIDFRDMAYPDDHFDAVVFDPPYKLNGKPTEAVDARYGVAGAYQSVEDRHWMIKNGITECIRVLKPGGYLMVKAQDQVSGGKVRWQTIEFSRHAELWGAELVDMLHFESYRPQPEGRAQHHARRNYSSMLVCRKDRTR